MFSAQELHVIRRAFAKQILADAQTSGSHIEKAFSAVAREDFLGPGPWSVFRRGRVYVPTPSNDPVYLYVDNPVGIDPKRRINNGQPSLHAYLLKNAGIKPGDHVVHIGAGLGYYSAIIAQLAGERGRVTAIEFESDLADKARENLKPWPNVEVLAGSGATLEFETADVIYLNAGATRPADVWLDRLAEGGRLILPLTTNEGFRASDAEGAQRHGAVFLITRKQHEFDAHWISPVAIYPCDGMRDEVSEKALADAFEGEGWLSVSKLYRRDDLPADQRWA